MELLAKDLAQLLNGTVEGNANIMVNDLSKIEEGKPNSISFLSNPQYTEYIYTTKASLVIVSNDFVAEKKLPENLTLIRVPDPRMSFAKLLEVYQQLIKKKPGISKMANIAESANIEKNVFIGDFVSIGENCKIGEGSIIHSNCSISDNVIIGKNCELHPGTRILHDCIIGNSCVFQSNAVIGSDGFGFAPNSDNKYNKVVHIGNVIVEDHVEIGANTTIDRATLGSTIIRKGVKLDNLIQVAHNVEIGENTVIAAQTGIAGSTKIGKNAMIGGQVGIIGHLNIADSVKIAAQSGIGSSITEEGSIVQGSPAMPIGDYKRAYVLFKNLPSLKNSIDELKSLHKND